MKYDFTCDDCGTELELGLPWQDYREEAFPVCTGCNRRMRRVWRNAARLDHQSKGKFGFVTKNMGDGEQYVHDYGDLQNKLKARGLHVFEPTHEDSYRAKHMADMGGRKNEG